MPSRSVPLMDSSLLDTTLKIKKENIISQTSLSSVSISVHEYIKSLNQMESVVNNSRVQELSRKSYPTSPLWYSSTIQERLAVLDIWREELLETQSYLSGGQHQQKQKQN